MIKMGKNKDFHIDEDTNEVCIGGQKSKLTPKEMGVLMLLHQHQGSTVSRVELLEQVWGDKYANNQGLTQAISRLRDIFLESDFISIRTIPKKGYLLQIQTSRPNLLNLGTIRIRANRVVIVLLVLLIYILVFIKRISIRVDKLPIKTEQSDIRESELPKEGD